MHLHTNCLLLSIRKYLHADTFMQSLQSVRVLRNASKCISDIGTSTQLF